MWCILGSYYRRLLYVIIDYSAPKRIPTAKAVPGQVSGLYRQCYGSQTFDIKS